MIPLLARDANRARARVLCWRHAFKLRCVGAVKVIFERTAILLFDQPPVRSFHQQLLHSLLVLFRLETACAVNKSAARLEQSRRGPRDLELLASDLRYTIRS